jgi:uncharacterized membrane-anchored protein YhcB (DUF1043 family)
LWTVAESVQDQPLFQIVQYGVLGLVVLGFMLGYIWARPAVARLERDLDKALADLRELEKLNREVIIPAITRSSEIIERLSRKWRDE